MYVTNFMAMPVICLHTNIIHHAMAWGSVVIKVLRY